MASANQVVVPAEVKTALGEFRGDVRADMASRFIVIGYADKQTLAVKGTGAGGVADAAPFLSDDDANYVLVRLAHRVEMANTVKFGYVDYTPDSIKPMRKALLSTHKGQVEDLMKPFHVSIQASSRADLRDEEILHRVGASSGSLDFSKTALAASGPAAPHAGQQQQQQQRAPGAKLVPDSVKDSKVQVEDPAALQQALAAVRSDSDPTNWCLVTYGASGGLAVVATGSDGVEGLRARMDSEHYFFALLRASYTYDQSEVVRFGFVRVLSDAVPPMKRATYSTQVGAIRDAFGQHHHEFNLDRPSDLTQESVDLAFKGLLGTVNRVREAGGGAGAGAAAAAASPARQAQHPGGSGAHVVLESEDEFRRAVHDVHHHTDSTTWALATYAAKNTLKLVARGTGGAAEMMAACPPGFSVGVLRVSDLIDGHETVKFALVRVLDDTVKPMVRGQLGTITGSIEDIFRPFHVALDVSAPGELTQEMVADRVSAASFSKHR